MGHPASVARKNQGSLSVGEQAGLYEHGRVAVVGGLLVRVAVAEQVAVVPGERGELDAEG